MKFYALAFAFLVMSHGAVCADSFMGDVTADFINLNADTVIGENVRFEPDVVNVNRTIDLINNGLVNTDFVVCERCEFRILNHGDFSANFNLGMDATLVQVVSGVDDFNPIVSNVKYTLMIDGADNIYLNAGVNAGALNKLVIQNSIVDINNFDFRNLDELDLFGDIVFVVDDLSDMYDVPIVNNVSVNGRIYFQSDVNNPLFADVGYIDDGRLFVKRVRETDYVKVLNSKAGLFLNNLRAKNPDDGLLKYMDSAMHIDALRDAMMRSVRFNPSVLGNIIEIINSFDKFLFKTDAGIYVDGNLVWSDNFYSYGVNLGGVDRIGDVDVAINMRVGNIEYETELDNFTGVYYGLNLNAKYLMKNNFWVRGLVDVTRFDFDTGDVFYENRVINNPSAVSINAVADFGYRYALIDSLYIAPFVGIDMSNYRMESVTDGIMHARGGVMVGYQYEMMGIKYNYDAMFDVASQDVMRGVARIGFWSAYDMIGGNTEFSVVRMFDTLSYKMSIAGRLRF